MKKLEILSQVQGSLREILQELYADQKERIGDLTQWSEKRLITTSQLFEFWCVDALARLIRLPDDKKLDVWKLYYRLEEIARSLSLDELTECYLQTRDAKSVTALAVLHIDVEAIQAEIERRFVTQRIGSVFSYILDHPNDRKGIVKLLNTIAGPISSLAKRWNKSFEMAKLIRALRAKEYDTEQEIENMDDKNESLLKIYNLYDELKKAVELNDLESIPISLIGNFRKSNSPIWETESPAILKKLVKEVVKTRLPILSGGMETIPLRIYNDQRALDIHNTVKITDQEYQKSRRMKRVLQLSSLDTQKDDESEIDKILYTQGGNEDEEQIIERIFQNEKKDRIGVNNETLNLAFVDEEAKKAVLKFIESNLEGQRKTTKKIKRYFELLLDGKTEKEALKEAHLPARTKRRCIEKLRLKSNI